jgi:DNA polymerase-4
MMVHAFDNSGVKGGHGEPRSEATILHVDMDAFFASVEIARRPELAGRPMIVASSGRSVVLAATYEARPYGIHSGMPAARARRACPGITVVPPSHTAYREVSRGVMAILGAVSPHLEQISVDEAFIDVRGALRALGSPRQIAEHIRERVRAEYGIACSVGIGPTKSVAKIASRQAKPDGVVEVPAEQALAFLHPLEVGQLWGVGSKTREELQRWGINTVGELAHTSPGALARAVGRAQATRLLAIAWGKDSSPVESRREEKSVGTETTFDTDIAMGPQLRRALLALANRSAARLRKANLAASTVSVKVRTADFKTVTRSKTLPAPVDTSNAVFVAAWALLRAVNPRQPVRLLGVRLEHLNSALGVAVQDTFDGFDPRPRAAELAADQVRRRFGDAALGPAELLDRPGPFQR